MYCPRCGVDNLNEASFCRSCGADVSLVPQALTGRLPETTTTVAANVSPRKGKGTKIEDAVSTMFVGLAFLLIVIGGAIFFTGGFMIWIWMLIPGFACLGSGVGKYMQIKQDRAAELPPHQSATMRPAPLFGSTAAHNINTLPARDTAEIVASFDRAPSSVTEGTTRLLDEDAAPRRETRVPYAATGNTENQS